MGPRQGSSVSKEQYAFVYRPSRVTIHANFSVSATAHLFERPPLVAVVEVGAAAQTLGPLPYHANSTKRHNQLFQVLVLHAKPGSDVTYAELKALDAARAEATRKTGVASTILAGDFNAGCSYLPQYRKNEVTIFKPPYIVFINDSADTTSTNSDCPYDRIVGHGDSAFLSRIESTAVVNLERPPFSFSQERAKAASDHYPVAYLVAAAAADDTEGESSGPYMKPAVAVGIAAAGTLLVFALAIVFVVRRRRQKVTGTALSRTYRDLGVEARP